MQQINSETTNILAKRNELESLIKENDRIFIDTCALLVNQAQWSDNTATKFWNNIVPLLRQYNKTIIVPFRVAEEIIKHTNNVDDSTLQKIAKEELNRIRNLYNNNIIDIFGDKSDNTHADNVFDTIFTQFRVKYTMLLITRDYNLARDILALNDKKATNGKKVEVRIISSDGFLIKPNLDLPPKTATQTNHANQTQIQPFMIGVQITDISNDIIPTHHIPKSKDFVFTTNGAKIELKNEIGKGGEGAVFETNTPYIAKIYFKERITKRIYEKIKLMVTRQIRFDGICFPVDMLFNAHNEFVGYLMPKASGYNLQRTMLTKPLLKKYFPNFKKRDMIELCITILEKITFLHSLNVILGDINPNNILVVSPKEVYFVDTDSYQIGEFPCPVGMINFTAPEIQGKNYATFLRTIGNDKFAVATLLFMIMLPGKPPYSQQGGSNPALNIKNGDFPYAFEGESNKNTPDGPWRFMWSHLSYEIKKSFYHTFKKGGNHNDKNKRISAKKWLELFRQYHNVLKVMTETDEMANDIFPTRIKKIKGKKYIRCKLCNQEVAESEREINGFCKSCLFDDTKAEIYKCISCGEVIFYKNFDKYITKKPKPKKCLKCLGK